MEGMLPFLREMDATQLYEAFIANYAGFIARLGELPGATIVQGPGLTWVDTGIPQTDFNGVAHAALGGDAADAAIASVVAHFQARDLPCHWSLGPEPQPEMPAHLIAHGFAFEETEPAMAADLDALDASLPPVADLTIVPVATPAQVAQWASIWGGTAPRHIIEQRQAVYHALMARIPSAEFTLYLGMRGDVPVGTVYLYCHAGVAAVHYVVTPPALRRQGIGAALTLHAMQAARSLGYHVAILTASPYGIGIYRRLGFREFGNFSTYVWEPAQG
jgi:GNAT superfamily N-acetyltransferase